MILEQQYLSCLAHASYLVADERSGSAAVVDPRRDVDVYLDRARELGVRIEHVVLTHLHADFVAGHLELRERVGARIHLGVRATAGYEFSPLRDGDVIRLGAVWLEAMETPGHSPESICLAVHDGDHGRPHAVLTGDTLLVGDVGRPDLRAALGWPADRLADMLYDSVHGRLFRLPDETLVYPAHGAGSACSRSMSRETVSTIGAERRRQGAAGARSRRQFVAQVLAGQSDPPAYFAYDVVVNGAERPMLESGLRGAARALTLDVALAIPGVQLVDAREPAAFARAHLRNAINISLDGRFAMWAGAVLDPHEPIVVLAEPGREDEAALRLGRIGFDRVAGHVAGAAAALAARPDLIDRHRRITPAALADLLAGEVPPTVLDVRGEAEWREHRIEGSVNVPLTRLRDRLPNLPRDARIVTCCATGYRSAVAVGILRAAGFARVDDLAGGLGAYDAEDRARGTMVVHTAAPLNAAICEVGDGRARGYALTGGARRIERVEVSVDGGRCWTPADVLHAGPAGSWCLWEARIGEAAEGAVDLVVRAWDSAAMTQPESAASCWNPEGYLNNAWHRAGRVARAT